MRSTSRSPRSLRSLPRRASARSPGSGTRSHPGRSCTPCTAATAMRGSSMPTPRRSGFGAMHRSRGTRRPLPPHAPRAGIWRDSREHLRAPAARCRHGSDAPLDLVSLRERAGGGEGADLLPGVGLCRPRGGARRARSVPRSRYPRREHHPLAQSRGGVARLLQRLSPSRRATVPRGGCARFGRGGGIARGAPAPRRHLGRPHHLPLSPVDLRLERPPDRRALADERAGVRPDPLQPLSGGCRVLGRLRVREPEPREGRIARRAARRDAQTTRPLPLSELRIGHSIRYQVGANWKVLCENYNECYHCGGGHPELCALVPAFRERGGGSLDWLRGIPHRDGAYTFTKSGTSRRRPFPTLNEDERVRHKGELVFPNLFVSLACEHVAAFILEPRGAARTDITCHFLFEPFEIDKPDFDPSDTTEFWDLVNVQDRPICEAGQPGISARVHERGFYAPMEDFNLDIRRYVLERIGDSVDS